MQSFVTSKTCSYTVYDRFEVTPVVWQICLVTRNSVATIDSSSRDSYVCISWGHAYAVTPNILSHLWYILRFIEIPQLIEHKEDITGLYRYDAYIVFTLISVKKAIHVTLAFNTIASLPLFDWEYGRWK